jgi:hypothetical protein
VAAEHGQLEVTKLLLEMEAEPNIRDKDNRTALSWAIEHRHMETARLLRDHHADLDAEGIALGLLRVICDQLDCIQAAIDASIPEWAPLPKLIRHAREETQQTVQYLSNARPAIVVFDARISTLFEVEAFLETIVKGKIDPSSIHDLDGSRPRFTYEMVSSGWWGIDEQELERHLEHLIRDTSSIRSNKKRSRSPPGGEASR